MNSKPTTALFFVIFVSLYARNVNGGRARPAVKRPNFSTSTPLPSNVVGLRGYSRFHANDSLIGRPVPCTRDEKICFRYNLIFDPKTDRCQPIGGDFDVGCDLMPNRTEFERGSGHIFGACSKYEDPCPGYRMAFDGRCYRKHMVRDALCGCKSEPTRHFLGGVECRCSSKIPVAVKQPREEGRCLVPDLRFPVDRSSLFKLRAPAKNASNNSSLPTKSHKYPPSCSPEQKKCFAMGMVWVSQGKNCFTLLQQGPCAKDQVVVMSPSAWTRQSAICRQVRGGCPSGQKRMAFDSRCHDKREITLTAPGRIDLDIFGEYVVMNRTEVVSHRPAIINDTCVIFSGNSMPRPTPAVMYPKPPCGTGKDDLCFLHEVVSTLPPPENEPDHYAENVI